MLKLNRAEIDAVIEADAAFAEAAEKAETASGR